MLEFTIKIFIDITIFLDTKMRNDTQKKTSQKYSECLNSKLLKTAIKEPKWNITIYMRKHIFVTVQR